jgi:hypothetical protein
MIFSSILISLLTATGLTLEQDFDSNRDAEISQAI